MRIEFNLWELMYLTIILVGAFWALGKILAAQFSKRLEEKFSAQAEARKVADETLNATLVRHLEEERHMAAKIEILERDFRDWKGELPIRYVLREDYIRGQVTLEHKLDEVHKKSEATLTRLERLLGKMEGEGK